MVGSIWMRIKMIGIYKIENKVTGKVYIGSSTKLFSRWSFHVRKLKANYQCNKNMQIDYKEHGLESFTFEIIEECDKSELLVKEQEYIDRYAPGKLYNIQKVGRASKPVSAETGIKIGENTSKGLKGKPRRPYTAEQRERMSNLMKELHQSPEFRKMCTEFTDEQMVQFKKSGIDGARISLRRRMRRKALRFMNEHMAA